MELDLSKGVTQDEFTNYIKSHLSTKQQYYLNVYCKDEKLLSDILSAFIKYELHIDYEYSLTLSVLILNNYEIMKKVCLYRLPMLAYRNNMKKLDDNLVLKPLFERYGLKLINTAEEYRKLAEHGVLDKFLVAIPYIKMMHPDNK